MLSLFIGPSPPWPSLRDLHRGAIILLDAVHLDGYTHTRPPGASGVSWCCFLHKPHSLSQVLPWLFVRRSASLAVIPSGADAQSCRGAAQHSARQPVAKTRERSRAAAGKVLRGPGGHSSI